MRINRMLGATERNGKRCIFCGKDKSVKYEVNIHNSEIAPKPFDAYCCNRCALQKNILGAREMERVNR